MTDAPVITVRGEAVVEAQPEVAHVTVHVQAQEKDRRLALDRLTERNRACLDLVRSYGEAVERVESGGLAISPVIRYGKHDDGEIRGYRGTAQIKLAVVDFSLLGELLTRLGDGERSYVHGPYWALRPDSPVFDDAARQAVHEAVARARGYAGALGARLTALLELRDENTGGVPERPMALMAAPAPGGAAGGAPAPITVEPETQTVRASVIARFAASSPEL
ncbi:SIMPL domain-containing protein [Actinomadura flavalba]|uniref:SIMPL domain-containing protein n=1 Tax=Actinomadura flavalba TaxID=1120938 RepID=UPI00035F0E4C|nr:SIMPL domain-containing protein [Actinomadura flavalba]